MGGMGRCRGGLKVATYRKSAGFVEDAVRDGDEFAGGRAWMKK